MKTSSLSLLIATSALALLSACGGERSDMVDDPTITAGMVQNTPVADCEAEGCNKPRNIDNLAEQYRTNANEAPAPAPVQAPAIDPVQAAEAKPTDVAAGVTAEVTTAPHLSNNADQAASATSPAAPDQPQQGQYAQ